MRKTGNNTDISVIILKRTKAPRHYEPCLGTLVVLAGMSNSAAFSHVILRMKELKSFKLLKPENMILNSVLMIMPGVDTVHVNDSARQHGSDAGIDRHNGLQIHFSSLEKAGFPVNLNFNIYWHIFPLCQIITVALKWRKAIMVKCHHWHCYWVVRKGPCVFQRIWSASLQFEGCVHILHMWRAKVWWLHPSKGWRHWTLWKCQHLLWPMPLVKYSIQGVTGRIYVHNSFCKNK